MSQFARQDDPTMILARAFDRAWKRHYLPDRSGTISEEIARHSLAKHLVAMMKEGVKEEDVLAAGGLLHLNSLTPEMLDEAVTESTRHPLVSSPSEPPVLVQDRDQPRTLLGVASRVATAIGISAILAFAFFVLVPKSQESDATELAVFEHRTLPSAGAVQITSEESQALFEKFLQWRQRK